MPNAVSEATKEKVEFGSDTFMANARAYRTHKRLIDAIANGKYESPADAMAAVKNAWEALMLQIENGSGYTPDRSLGFGSDNGSQVAEAITGRRPSVGSTRKAFADMGK